MTFGLNFATDIEEMLNVLHEHGDITYRPAKLRKLFASKACRKAVMIGAHLEQREMETIVQHLAQLDNPWVTTILLRRSIPRRFINSKLCLELPARPTHIAALCVVLIADCTTRRRHAVMTEYYSPDYIQR